jgi:hypothetical protein
MSKMRAEYLLDLTNAKLPSWWPKNAPLVIPLIDGRWFMRYDVMEERLPGFRGPMMLAQRRKWPHIHDNKNCILPFGFDELQLPPGAVLLGSPDAHG